MLYFFHMLVCHGTRLSLSQVHVRDREMADPITKGSGSKAVFMLHQVQMTGLKISF